MWHLSKINKIVRTVYHVGESFGEMTGEKINDCHHFDLDISGDTLIVAKYNTQSLQRYQLSFGDE